MVCVVSTRERSMGNSTCVRNHARGFRRGNFRVDGPEQRQYPPGDRREERVVEDYA